MVAVTCSLCWCFQWWHSWRDAWCLAFWYLQFQIIKTQNKSIPVLCHFWRLSLAQFCTKGSENIEGKTKIQRNRTSAVRWHLLEMSERLHSHSLLDFKEIVQDQEGYGHSTNTDLKIRARWLLMASDSPGTWCWMLFQVTLSNWAGGSKVGPELQARAFSQGWG